MSDSARSNRRGNPVRQLVALAALAAFLFLCTRTLRFTIDGLNLAFGALFLLLPFFAIKPALRLPRWGKIIFLTLLTPVLLFSAFGLMAMVACDIPDAVHHVPLSRELCSLQQGHYSVDLLEEETAGGAIGPHGVGLEQRRTIFRGIYAVRFLDYFEGAYDGTVSFIGPDRISLYLPMAGYHLDQKDLRREYSLKPWLYF